jgi:hypothetical protein
MNFTEVASFDVVHAHLSWPWLAFDARGQRIAFASSPSRIATRVLAGSAITEGPSFEVPPDVGPAWGAFALGADGTLVAIACRAGGDASDAGTVITSAADGERARSRVDALAGPGFAAKALAFDRSGTRLWISAESETASALVLIDARSHDVLGVVRSAAFPPPSMHELYVHPQDDAVLLVAACGEEGTFARVAGWAGNDGAAVSKIDTALDAGGIPAGFVGFSADGARVHLAEADELRTHAWPGLEELSSVELADEFVSSFAGAVMGDRILVDGEDAESRDDAVMVFDRSAIVGSLVYGDDVPRGMWAGRLGTDCIVTVESKGEPSRGRVVRVVV